jgi:hypothetical protein
MREFERQPGDDSPGYKRGPLATLRELLNRPDSPPSVAHRVPFPDAGRLREWEKYLLHRRLLEREERYHLIFAYPVWLVVTAAEGEASGWHVVHDNICPRCGHTVPPGHLAGGGGDRSHRLCQDLWGGETG